MANEKQVEYMAYPRACALAEVTWSPKSHRNWNDFQGRMSTHHMRLGILEVNARIPFELTITERIPGTATITTSMPGATIHYTLDGTQATANSPEYTKAITVTRLTPLRTVAILKNGTNSPERQRVLLMPKITVTTSLPVYKDHVAKRIVDGRSSSVFWSSRPPSAKDHVTLTFETPTVINHIKIMTGKTDGGDTLENGVLEVSEDGVNFTSIATFKKGIAADATQRTVMAIRIRPTKSQSSWLVVRDVLLK